MIKALIFDMGRVFLHDPDNEIIFRDMATACDLPYSLVEQIVNELISPYQKGELTDETFWQTFQQRTGLRKFPDDYQELWTRKYLELGKIDYEVLDLVRELHRNAYKTPVLSNTIPPHVRVNHERGLFTLFTPEIFSWEVKFRKPEPEIYKAALQQTGVLAEEAVYIDDIQKYVDAAKQLGMYGIWYQGLPQLKEDLKKLGVNT